MAAYVPNIAQDNTASQAKNGEIKKFSMQRTSEATQESESRKPGGKQQIQQKSDPYFAALNERQNNGQETAGDSSDRVNLAGNIRFSNRDTSNVRREIADFVDRAVQDKRSNDSILVTNATQKDNNAINKLGMYWHGKYTGSERTMTGEYIRHILRQHGNAFIEALRGQLYMDTDAIKIALSNLAEGKGRIAEGTYSRRGNPTITTEIPIDGYTIYVEEPMPSLSGTVLEGRTAYLRPTPIPKVANIPQRGNGQLRSAADGRSRVMNGYLVGKNQMPVRLFAVDKDNFGVYSMSTDREALNTTGRQISGGSYYASIKNPYIVTADNPIITDEDLRDAKVASKIAAVQRAGYDSIIMDNQQGDNYFVMVFDKRAMVKVNSK